MIRYLENPQIELNKWDECIEHSVNSRVYAFSWYLNIVHPQWSALVLDDYQAVFPVIGQTKWGLKYAFQPAFTQQLGLFTPLLLTPELTQQFLEKLLKLFPLIQMNLNMHNKIPQGWKFIQKSVNHELDLVSPYDVLKTNYASNLKRNIKKARNARISILKNLKPESIIELFRLNRGKQIDTLRQKEYNTLNRLVYKALSQGKASIWGAFTADNNLCAGAIFIRDHHRFIFLFSATNKEARELGAMSYLIDSFIENHAATPAILDFEGSNNPNLARFYKSFGSNVIHYPKINYQNFPWPLNWAWNLKSLLWK